MNIKEYQTSLIEPLQRSTITFLVTEKEILLAMKKRGFGQGKWNGVGGKPKDGETTLDAAIRESKEEIDVFPQNPELVAVIYFYHPYQSQNKGWNQEVSVYLARGWQGEPKESEEMKPQWFNLDEIPYHEMWWDDEIWIPIILSGKKVRAGFMFDETEKIIDQIIETVEYL